MGEFKKYFKEMPLFGGDAYGALPEKERETKVQEKPLLTPEQQRVASFFAKGVTTPEPEFEGPVSAPLDPLEAQGIGQFERFGGSQPPAISGLAGEALTGLLTGEGRGIEMLGSLFDVSRQLSARGDADITEQIRTAATAQGAGGSGQLLETLRRFGEGRALGTQQSELSTLSNAFMQAIGGAQTQAGIEDRQTTDRASALTGAGGLQRGVADLNIQRLLELFSNTRNREIQKLGLAGGFAADDVPFGVTDYSAFTPTFAGQMTSDLIKGGTDLFKAFAVG